MSARRALGLLAIAAVAVGAAGCGDDDGGEATATFASIASSDTGVTETATPGAGGDAAEGFVQVQVRLGVRGIDEMIDLDRGSVGASSLDPLSLDARCTALDGGDGFVVSVVDLRRVSAGDRLVSASLRVDGEVAAAGAYQGTLDVGDTRQVVTSYVGGVTLADGLASGTFDMVDVNGQSATGTFTCADQAPVAATTTTVASTTTTIPEATS